MKRRMQHIKTKSRDAGMMAAKARPKKADEPDVKPTSKAPVSTRERLKNKRI